MYSLTAFHFLASFSPESRINWKLTSVYGGQIVVEVVLNLLDRAKTYTACTNQCTISGGARRGLDG